MQIPTDAPRSCARAECTCWMQLAAGLGGPGSQKHVNGRRALSLVAPSDLSCALTKLRGSLQGFGGFPEALCAVATSSLATLGALIMSSNER